MKNATAVLIGLLLVTGGALAADSVNKAELTDRLRQTLESQFHASTGLGFASFHCDFPADGIPTRELTCQAVDDEGDQFFYRMISPEDGQEPSVSTYQPVSQLNASGLELIERPCLAFLKAFERGAWDDAYQELSAEFQAALSPAEFEASLSPVRLAIEGTGSIQAELYTSPSAAFHGIEYALETEGGDAVARFRVQFVDEQQARIVAFLITAKPGSPLQATLLSQTGRQSLGALFGQEVVNIAAPLEQLELIGDSVEGLAWLDDGQDIAIRVVQRQSAYDLDGNDYGFQVLDVPWLIRRYLKSSGAAPLDIMCPHRVVPDGSRIDCLATLENGSERPVSLVRTGGEYRLVEQD